MPLKKEKGRSARERSAKVIAKEEKKKELFCKE